MKGTKEGFTIVNLSEKTYNTCVGCKYLTKTAGLRGHKKVTNHFGCSHDSSPDTYIVGLNFNVGYNVEGKPITPIFCPYLK